MTVIERIASLTVVDFEALAKNDSKEIQKLVQACQSVGMFYLKLGDSRLKSVYEDIPSLIQAGNAFFKLPPDSEEKKQSIREGMERGYHAAKTFQYYEIARNEYEQGQWTMPASLAPHEERISRTLRSLHHAIQTILVKLCAAVQVDIPELNDDAAIPSDTALKLVYKPPIQEPGAIVQPCHTDFGLMTLMWYDAVSAQIPIYDTEGNRTEDWQAVPVVEGAVLVNIADELEAKSGGRLRSTVHRAVTPPGPKQVRNGLVYLLRPYMN
ncbi:oxidoreductase [Aspergillus avenaceus]|uniref:Oxidoreductase n=1 Tax=Aspergillus avenaceus TaxID=36643 RepID=A0A5N6TKT6_ASPAV|nr:oxidoreductase [Aspergillus avenaceus]